MALHHWNTVPRTAHFFTAYTSENCHTLKVDAGSDDNYNPDNYNGDWNITHFRSRTAAIRHWRQVVKMNTDTYRQVHIVKAGRKLLEAIPSAA
jgi:hypothetical protein